MQVRRSRLWLLIIIIGLMGLSYYAGQQSKPFPHNLGIRHWFAGLDGAADVSGTIDDVSLKPVIAFQEAMSALRQNYVDGIDKKTETELTYSAIRGLLGGLHDPYTRFLDPKEFDEFKKENSGHYQGIGATLELTEATDPAELDKKNKPEADASLPPFRCAVCGADWVNPMTYRVSRMTKNGFEAEYTHELPIYRNYRVAVVAPFAGGPADKVGIKAGDQIVKVDDISTFGLSLDDVVKHIQGPGGTTVNLLIVRKGVSKPLSFKITRGEIDVPSAEVKVLPDNIGYLRINSFNGNPPEQVEKGLAKLQKAGVKGLLLDLRNNPGGSLENCLQIANQLLPAGPIVLIQSKGEDAITESAPKSSKGLGLPIVTLVNQGSASASEILAGALQDRKVSKLVGERTFGKGLVQTVGTMRDGSAIIITTAVYFTPLHRDVNKNGIEPDIVVQQPETERANIKFLSEQDLQAKEALKLLKSEMISPAKAAQAKMKLAPLAN